MTLVSLMTACTTAPALAPDAGVLALAARSPYRTMAIGLCEDYPPATRTLAAARRDLETCRRAGASVLRISFSWCEIEATPGQYDLAFWDEYVRMAVDEFGLRLIPYVCYTPRWATDRASNHYYTAPPRDPEYFARFVHMLVTRYRGRIHSWELWNEPDNPAYWTGTTAQYADLVKAGALAVRAADPGAKVVLGGIAWNHTFVGTLLKDYGLSPFIDVVNTHAYFETWHEDALEALPDYINRVADLIAQYGDHQQLWLAEVGYANFRPPASRVVSEQYAARFAYEHTPEYQGDVLLRSVVLAAATGKVSLLAWYRINDLPSTTEVIGDVNNRYLGLIDAGGHPKPALAALGLATDLFAKPLRCLDATTMALRPIASRTVVHSFQISSGDALVVAWQQTNRPGEGARPPAGDAQAPAPGSPIQLLLPIADLHRVSALGRHGATSPPPDVSPCGAYTLLGDLRPQRDQVQICRASADTVQRTR